MPQTRKYEIELPEVPDTHELVGHVVPQPGDLYLTDTNNAAEWVFCERGFSYQLYITARKKRTLADWANEQELFKALAKMRTSNLRYGTVVTFLPSEQLWSFGGTYYNLGVPPAGLFGRLKLTNGKWELA